MIRWLYRYVFRGIGILLAIGMITILFLAIRSEVHPSAQPPDAPAQGGRR